MAESSGHKILRFPNRQERRANLSKARKEGLKPESLPEVVVAGDKEEVKLEDVPGYPDFDTHPHDPQEDYFEKLKAQKVKEFDFVKAKELRKVKRGNSILARLDQAQGKVIPRYLRRALFSGEEERVEACIQKALKEGWTELELEDQVNLLAARIAAGEEIE